MLCKNYRGIAINDILFRLFDSILRRRLSMWYNPSKEQAGSQKGRSCIDHILTIRLLIDHAKKARIKLYILFIDFEKAYDKVPRVKLIEESANIYTNKGVKQESATSCILFVLYVDRMIKEYFEMDGYLGALHILMLMDDTVLLSTSKQGLISKFKICQKYCKAYGIPVNLLKTKFMVINTDGDDMESIIANDIIVKYCSNYKYLETFVTDDGAYKTVLHLHIKEKTKDIIKFYTFVNHNPALPYSMKRRVAESCILSSLLYGCETWMCNNYGKVESAYFSIIKCLLNVRETTCNDITLIESGFPTLKSTVESRMSTFMKKKMNLSNDDPLQRALNLVKATKTKSYVMLCDSMEGIGDIMKQGNRELQQRI